MNLTGEMQCRDMLCSDINCFLTIYIWNIFNSQQAPKCINNAWVKTKVRKYEDCNNEIQCNQKHEKKNSENLQCHGTRLVSFECL